MLTRDTEAVENMHRIFEITFPNVRSASDVNIREFNRYCLRPATKMRGIIKNSTWYS